MERFKYEGLLDNVWLANGFLKKNTPYGSATVIEEIRALGIGVLAAVLRQPARLNGGAIAFLRTKLDITQTECAERLGVKEQTVSLWERGRHSIPLAEDVLLRSLVIERLESAQMDALGRVSILDLTRLAAPQHLLNIVFVREDSAWKPAYEYSVVNSFSVANVTINEVDVDATWLDLSYLDVLDKQVHSDPVVQFVRCDALKKGVTFNVELIDSSFTDEFEDVVPDLQRVTVTSGVNLNHTFH